MPNRIKAYTLAAGRNALSFRSPAEWELSLIDNGAGAVAICVREDPDGATISEALHVLFGAQVTFPAGAQYIGSCAVAGVGLAHVFREVA